MQHDMEIAGGSGMAVRQDMNAALQALASASSGATAPGTSYPYQFWADTAGGVLRQRNAANSAWIVRGPLAETLVVTRAANVALGVGDWARTIIASGTWTQTFNAAAALGDGWFVEFRNNGSGVITLDPSGAELIDGVSTIQLAPGEACSIYCNGAAFYTIGRTASAQQSQTATAFTAGGAAPSFTLTPMPALAAYVAGQRFRVKFGVAGSGADTLNISNLGAKSIRQYDAAGVKVPAVVAAGQLADIEYDGADFVMLNPLPGVSASGSAPLFACRAWVNFNGTGTVSIRGSGNVSSVTDNGAGNYTVNLSVPLPDDKYSVSISADTDSDVVNNFSTPAVTRVCYTQQSLNTAGAFRIFAGASSPGSAVPVDFRAINASIFR